jgi:hypothetical protein
VDGEPSEVVASDLALAGVESDTDFDSQVACGFADGLGAANGPRRTVKGCDKAVACSVDLVATKASELLAHGSIVSIQGQTPALVAERRGLRGRSNDVGEEHGGEDPVDGDHGPLAREELSNLVKELVIGKHVAAG